jgi:hypothetical protein
MNPERKAVRPLILTSSLTLLMLAAAVSAPAFTEEALTRQQRGGGVMISLTYLNPAQKTPAGKIAFMLRMNTHSVDLDQYDIAQLASLRDDQGREVQALPLASPMGGGHHRSGMLVFPESDAAGNSLVRKDTKYLQVIIREVARKDRWVFQWDLPLRD